MSVASPEHTASQPPTRGRVRTGIALLVIAAAAFFVMLGVAFARPVHAYTMEITPFEECHSASTGALVVLEATLSPSTADATAIAGTSVTFSGRSHYPVRFAVASSQTALSSPDIDSGLGAAVSSGVPPEYTYTFPSTKATAKPGTVYWDASFSTAEIPACAGLGPYTETTSPRTLTVVPPTQTKPATPAPSPTPAPLLAPAPEPLAISIIHSGRFSLTHPTFSYRVHCTHSCFGDTYYQVFLLRPHHKAHHIAMLDLEPTPVAISATSGGDQQLARSYHGGLLRTLASDLRAGNRIELQITVKATGTSGVARAQSTAHLDT